MKRGTKSGSRLKTTQKQTGKKQPALTSQYNGSALNLQGALLAEQIN